MWILGLKGLDEGSAVLLAGELGRIQQSFKTPTAGDKV